MANKQYPDKLLCLLFINPCYLPYDFFEHLFILLLFADFFSTRKPS